MGESENIFSTRHLPVVNERVKQLVDFYANGSVKRFSEMIHLSSSQKLNRVFNLDKRNNEYPEVSSDILLSIANMFADINTEWLLTGRGEMTKTSQPTPTEHIQTSCVSKNKDKVDGLILLGSYIYGDVSAQDTLTIYGSLNTSVKKKIDYKKNIVVIQGGNHANFGNYGYQKGDAKATISRKSQQNQTIKAIDQFIKKD